MTEPSFQVPGCDELQKIWDSLFGSEDPFTWPPAASHSILALSDEAAQQADTCGVLPSASSLPLPNQIPIQTPVPVPTVNVSEFVTPPSSQFKRPVRQTTPAQPDLVATTVPTQATQATSHALHEKSTPQTQAGPYLLPSSWLPYSPPPLQAYLPSTTQSVTPWAPSKPAHVRDNTRQVAVLAQRATAPDSITPTPEAISSRSNQDLFHDAQTNSSPHLPSLQPAQEPTLLTATSSVGQNLSASIANASAVHLSVPKSATYIETPGASPLVYESGLSSSSSSCPTTTEIR